MEIMGNGSCVHGLEELMLLKCPYCPKQYIDLKLPRIIRDRNRRKSKTF